MQPTQKYSFIHSSSVSCWCLTLTSWLKIPGRHPLHPLYSSSKSAKCPHFQSMVNQFSCVNGSAHHTLSLCTYSTMTSPKKRFINELRFDRYRQDVCECEWMMSVNAPCTLLITPYAPVAMARTARQPERSQSKISICDL